ncbi:insulinase family protein [Micromonospora sp. NPDC049891]|uniref:insulinase family protein n=1 Tax=Micromonospora sp. NPDC049891 TaxID=3155655 RepID=UPI0033CB6CE8
MERTEIDGVPVLWKSGPAPLTASLVFGCGGRDETFRTIGVTHLVEHLAMSTLPRVHHDRNACVDLYTTEFMAAGRPEQLVAFLDGVCRALADLPLDRIGKEAGVLAAEGGSYVDPTVAALLTQRFGIQGLGLAPWHGPGFDRITEDQVCSYAARYFTAGNAVLVLNGPPPDGLRLPLPAGPRVEHPVHVPRQVPGPAWCEHAVPAVGAALLGRRDVAWSLGMAVLAERLEQIARHTHGLSYEIGGDAAQFDGDRYLYAITADAREGQEVQVARLLWDELRRMAEDGPTERELAEEREAAAEAYQDPRFVEVELRDAASGQLFGWPCLPTAERVALRAAVTPDDVRERFRAALASTQLVVPCGTTLDLPGLAGTNCTTGRSLPPGRVFQPPLLAKVFAREARTARLVLCDDGVAFRDSDGDVHQVRFSEVVGVEEHGPERTVFGSQGCFINVDPELYSGAEAAVRTIDATVPAQLRYRRSELIGED